MFIFHLLIFLVQFYLFYRAIKYIFNYLYRLFFINKNEDNYTTVITFRKLIIYKHSSIDGPTHLILYEKISKIEDVMDLEDYKFHVIEFDINKKKCSLINSKTEVTYPNYDHIENPVFIRKIVKAHFISVTKNIDRLDLTNYLLKFIGPKYNFYSDLTPKIDINISDILYLYNYNLFTDENLGTLEIEDNLGIIQNFILPWKLMWNPSILIKDT